MSPDTESCRAQLRDLLLPLKTKLHWYRAIDGHKYDIARLVSTFDLIHCVVLRNMPTGESDERARKKCIDRLMVELEQFGVDLVIFESRTPKLDNWDQKQINYLRTSKTLGMPVVARHIPGASEPMLWISDASAGAIGDFELYNQRQWRELLESQLYVVFAT